jgi:predicted RNA binding protein YcfA (HicA-like mRNA interferase family)
VKSLSGKEFCRLLENQSWQLLRVQGSHHIYGKSGSIVRISVPVHGNQTLKLGLMKHVLKLADIDENQV